MSHTNDGGPAFPHLHNESQVRGESEMFPGMSLRDYFAGQALIAFSYAAATHQVDDYDARSVASDAYGFADAMLAAREAK